MFWLFDLIDFEKFLHTHTEKQTDIWPYRSDLPSLKNQIIKSVLIVWFNWFWKISTHTQRNRQTFGPIEATCRRLKIQKFWKIKKSKNQKIKKSKNLKIKKSKNQKIKKSKNQKIKKSKNQKIKNQKIKKSKNQKIKKIKKVFWLFVSIDFEKNSTHTRTDRPTFGPIEATCRRLKIK